MVLCIIMGEDDVRAIWAAGVKSVAHLKLLVMHCLIANNPLVSDALILLAKLAQTG
jgi:hypothetical protein